MSGTYIRYRIPTGPLGGMGPFRDLLGNEASLADAAATNAMAFAPAPAPPLPTDALDALTSDFFFSHPVSVLQLCHHPPDAHFVDATGLCELAFGYAV